MRLRIPIAALVGLSSGFAVASAGMAQDDAARRAAMLRYETDASCAAAAESWLIGMPNGISAKEQNDASNVWGYYTKDAQLSAQAAGRPAYDGVGAAQAFVMDALPHLKSPDAAVAEKARGEAAEGTQQCAARPEFQNRMREAKP